MQLTNVPFETATREKLLLLKSFAVARAWRFQFYTSVVSLDAEIKSFYKFVMNLHIPVVWLYVVVLMLTRLAGGIQILNMRRTPGLMLLPL